MIIAKVLRTHAHQQRTVRVFARARVVAHAVDAQTIRLTCRRNHLAARTHAEGVCSAAVGRMDGELVVCRLQRGVRPAFAVLALADERLRMLNAHTHGEWLLLHAHALPEQRLHGVARAVTDGENHRVGADFLCFAAAEHRDALHAFAAHHQTGQARVKPHLTAQLDDFLPHRAHNALEQIRADVRFCDVQDVLRRAVIDEGLQHRANQR